MEIVKNRYGNDRVIEKISPTKLRIMGESLITRGSQDDEGNHTMYDFEGGPCLNVGAKIRFMKSNWTIVKITPEETNKENFASVLVEVKL
jgi:hypothetical protein|tara:strand:- start:638 stop:907 length:270 start_codon:yes stop_codon:yes gene_type:complete